MRTISFPNWENQLAASAASKDEKQSFAITIRWYLSHCQRQHCTTDFKSARQFINSAIQSKPQVSKWGVERWKEGIRWFFRNAPKELENLKQTTTLDSSNNKSKIKTMRLGESEPEWRLRMITALRRRHMSYRTETTYVGWVLRFSKFVGHHNLKELKTDSINHYMDHLARDLHVAVGTQRQALNALSLSI